MATNDYFTSMEGSLWVQPDGPNSTPYYLGCHVLEEVTVPKGDIELVRCPDPAAPNKWLVKGTIQAPPDPISFSIMTDLGLTADYLETIKFPFTLIVLLSKTGRKDVFTNWDRAFTINQVTLTTEGFTNLVGRDENVRSDQSFDCMALDLTRVFRYQNYGVSVTQAAPINAIHASDQDLPASAYVTQNDHCDEMWAFCDADSGVSAEVMRYTAASNAWAATAADPFAADEHIKTGTSFILDRDTNRVVAFRGSTDVGNPAECAYTDDNGATWTTVNIGSDNGEFVVGKNACHALDRYHLWVGTDSGRIYFSADGGASWTTQENAVIHSAAWNWIHMIDEKVGFAGGAADVIAKTVDGGVTWSQVTATGGGGDILTGWTVDERRVWVGTDDGELYYSNDAGLTWNERDFAGSGSGDVKDMYFLDLSNGVMVHDNATPTGRVFQTKDGGYTWEQASTPTNGGLHNVILCSNRVGYAVGETAAAAGYIMKLQA